MSLKEKVALVTGSTRGIGLAIAHKLAALGCHVVVTGRQEAQALEIAQKISDQYQVKTLAIAGDVASKDSIDLIVQKSLEEFQKVDILVNNAGITKDNLLLRMNEEDWDTVLDINLKSAFLFSKAVLRSMLKQKYGRIINISSIVGEIGNPGQVNYSASKGGLIALTKSLARELAAKNINVNAVAPGFISTEMTDQLTEEQRSQLTVNIPQKKLGNVQDVANGVAFLASEESAYITGQVLAINGGLSM